MRRRAMMGVDSGGGLHGQYHPVTFVDHTGAATTIMVKNGEACTPPTPAVYPRLIFDHWTHDTGNVVSDMVVGAQYDTEDQAVFVHVTNTDTAAKTLYLNINLSLAGSTLVLLKELFNESTGELISSITYTYSGAGNVRHSFSVPATGDYYVKLTPVGNSANTNNNLGISTNNVGLCTGTDFTYLKVKKVFVGSKFRVFRNSFNNTVDNLEQVIIPTMNESAARPLDYTATASTLFVNNPYIKCIILDGKYTVGNAFLNNMPNMEYFVMADTVGHSNSLYRDCPKLKKLILPNGISTVTGNFLTNMSGLEVLVLQPNISGFVGQLNATANVLKKVILKRSSARVSATANLLSNLNADTLFYVPDALLSSYTGAATWNGIAGQIKPMSELNIQ